MNEAPSIKRSICILLVVEEPPRELADDLPVWMIVILLEAVRLAVLLAALNLLGLAFVNGLVELATLRLEGSVDLLAGVWSLVEQGLLLFS